MAKSKANRSRVVFWVIVALAILVAIFLVVGIVVENRKPDRERAKTDIPSDKKNKPAAAALLATPLAQTSAPAVAEFPSPKEKVFNCQKLQEGGIAGNVDWDHESVLGWVPDNNERLLLTWKAATKSFRLYSLVVQGQSAHFVFYRDYPLFCKGGPTAHCLASYAQESDRAELITDGLVGKGTNSPNDGMASFYEKAGGVLNLKWGQQKLFIPFRFNKSEGPSFYSFLETCSGGSVANRWSTISDGRDTFNLGWSLEPKVAHVYLIQQSAPQTLALNYHGEAQTELLQVGVGGLRPIDCKITKSETTLLEATQKDSNWAFIAEQPGAKREVWYYRFEKGGLRLLASWKGEALGGQPRHLELLSDGSIFLEMSDWLGNKTTYRRIFISTAAPVVQSLLSQEEAALQIGPWLEGLSEARTRTSLSENVEDIAVVRQEGGLSSWEPLLLQKGLQNEILYFHFSHPLWDDAPAAKSVVWDKLTPRSYFVLELKRPQPQGTWILCPSPTR